MKQRRALEWLGGVGAYKLVDSAFDYGLYPFVIYRYGPIWGGLLMTGLSGLICLGYIWIYDRLGRDWLGIEFAKMLKSYEGPSVLRRALAWIARRGDLVAFFSLSIRFDPFITTAYLRRGRYNGLSHRDWVIFSGSILVSNAAWSSAWSGGVEVIDHLRSVFARLS